MPGRRRPIIYTPAKLCKSKMETQLFQEWHVYLKMIDISGVLSNSSSAKMVEASQSHEENEITPVKRLP